MWTAIGKNYFLSYTLFVFEPEETSPCDYGSRHPEETDFTQTQIEEWCVDEGKVVYVNWLIEKNLPQAMTISMIYPNLYR